MDHHPNNPMKPFNASEFISNQETPVICRNKNPVEIITAKGRGGMPVLAYIGDGDSIQKWNKGGMFYSNRVSEWDLFFAPKDEVVHVFRNISSGTIATTLDSTLAAQWRLYNTFTYLGTITGPIVPPEESK